MDTFKLRAISSTAVFISCENSAMAANLLTFRPVGIRACAVTGHRNPDRRGRISSSSSWWTPLFSWSSEPDYIDSDSKTDTNVKSGESSEPNSELKPAEPRFPLGCFTEEKAKQLRMMTNGSECFHDAMYHSAIASRLASDFKSHSDSQKDV